MNNKMNKSKITIISIIKRILIFLFIIFMHDSLINYKDPEILFELQFVPHFRKDAVYSSEEICHKNARMILNAIEKYDMNHNASMDELDMDLLYKEKCLSENSLKPVKDVKECHYTHRLIDDMGNHIISCSVHSSEYEKEEARKADYSKKKKINIIKLIIIALVSILIPTKWLPNFI